MNHASPIEKAKLLIFHVFGFFKGLSQEFMAQGCQRNAAALTYMTLFALVPMMTVIYSILSIIPFFHGVADQLSSMIFANFVPETGSQVQSYLTDFSSQARSLTGAGVAMLFVTAYLMLTNIEKTFNTIWGVTEARKGLSSFLLYWAVLSIGPMLIGLGLTMSTYLLSLRLTLNEYDPTGLMIEAFKFAPLLISVSIFTLLYAAVPNCRVPLHFAAAGGVVTAIGFELLKAGFAAMVANSSIKLVYGAFAAVPLFLMWVNLLWILVLGGAVFVRTLSEEAYGARRRKLNDMQAIMQCLKVFYDKSQVGLKLNDSDCVKLGLGLVHWQSMRSVLVKAGWISVTDGGQYVLSQDLARIDMQDVAQLANISLLNSKVPTAEQDAPWLQEYSRRLELMHKQTAELFSISLDELFSLQ